MPIACVDLIVMNSEKEILLLKRKNEPAKNEWWFPGGRIHFLEARKDAAVRKLYEECGLKGEVIKEIGTYDLILSQGVNPPSHAITTVFRINVKADKVRIDHQSVRSQWKSSDAWLKSVKAPFVKMILKTLKDIDASQL